VLPRARGSREYRHQQCACLFDRPTAAKRRKLMKVYSLLQNLLICSRSTVDEYARRHEADLLRKLKAEVCTTKHSNILSLTQLL
jgi:hypothetical protein